MQIVIDIDEDLYEGIERRDGALETEYVCNELMKAIDNGTPQQKTGQWLAKSFHEVYCDNCKFDFDIMTNEFIDKMKYCPNCGAKMAESEVEEMNTDKILAYIGRKIASYYALLADGENTRKTKERLLAKIDMLLELLDEFNIGYEIIGNNEGVTINKRSYTYTIKDYAVWSFCINEKEFVKCADKEE